MADESFDDPQFAVQDIEILDAEGSELSDEYEEISSDEVDRVVDALESLYDTVASENIQACLDEAINAIYYLVYDDEEEEAAEAA
ncbi:MAG: hypothetical protein WD069_19455 [Planctomycetales bacterium]